jgi:hypothetical protein
MRRLHVLSVRFYAKKKLTTGEPKIRDPRVGMQKSNALLVYPKLCVFHPPTVRMDDDADRPRCFRLYLSSKVKAYIDTLFLGNAESPIQ